MYRQYKIQQLYVLPTQCIYVLWGSENKQRLFPYTELPGGVCNEDGLCSLLGRQLEFQVLFKSTYSNLLTSHRGGAG